MNRAGSLSLSSNDSQAAGCPQPASHSLTTDFAKSPLQDAQFAACGEPLVQPLDQAVENNFRPRRGDIKFRAKADITIKIN